MNRLCFLSIVTVLGCVPVDLAVLAHTEFKLSTENNIIPESTEKYQKIPESVASLIEPSIKDWLQFYHLNILDFYLISDIREGKVQKTINDTESAYGLASDIGEHDVSAGSIYDRTFDPKIHDVYIPRLYDYSPSKQKYLNLLETSGVFQKDGKYYDGGGDDCQEIYLTDRKNKTTKMVLWKGSSEFVEAMFWLDENNFIAVGRKYADIYFIQTFSYGKEIGYYEYKAKTPFPDKSYYMKNLKSRGVVEPA